MCAVRICETNKKGRAVADYRFSANVISRSKGQSSIASAAYRSAERLIDERTGEIHDYTRKGGVIHSQVIAPEGTPDWMHDRAQLWNAVETVERRKDAQLSREIQLSLPHELNADQRKALVVGFVQEQFVARGMVADLNLHAPNAEGDQRNHHAHVMLTMRSLTGDGFGNKARDWNSPDQLTEWREQWARHQNRELERHGHEARVDHRSFEAQGIDREPTQHLGPVASDMERRGKDSRIGDQNREVRSINTDRVRDHVEAANVLSAIDYQKSKIASWAEQKRRELDNAQDLSKLDLAQKHDRQKAALDDRLSEIYDEPKAQVRSELEAVEKRLGAKGIKRVLRSVFGQNRYDQNTKAEMTATLADMRNREREQREALERRQDTERRTDARRMSKNKDRLERGVQKLKEKREAEGWKPTSPRVTKRVGRPDRAKTAKPTPSPVKTHKNAPKPPPVSNDNQTQATPSPAPPVEKLPPAQKPREGTGLRSLARSLFKAKANDSSPTHKAKTEPAADRATPAPSLSPSPWRSKKAPPPAPEVKPWDAPTLADEKRLTGHVSEEFKGTARKTPPWERATLEDRTPPWERSAEPAGRERTPHTDAPKATKK